jgi:hypothetical protein
MAMPRRSVPGVTPTGGITADSEGPGVFLNRLGLVDGYLVDLVAAPDLALAHLGTVPT